MKKILLFGRANVGKSTLFNKLTQRSAAIVYDQPGVTRDRREIPGTLLGCPFIAIDAPGFENSLNTPLAKSMRGQLEMGIQDADIILFVVDLKEGCHDMDMAAATWLRRIAKQKPIILVCNKAETPSQHIHAHAFFQLGFGEPVLVSAEHTLGFADLYEQMKEHLPMPEEPEEEEAEESEEESRIIDIAILGRPNVGKSTLFNALIGQQRSITGDQPGLTRDSIDHTFSYEDYTIRLVDTAGLRKKANITEDLEKLSAKDSLRSLRFCQVALLVVDAQMPLEKQDLTIGQHIVEEGRALILVVNKWDTIPPTAQQELIKDLQHRLENSLPQVKDVFYILLSALHNPSQKQLFSLIIKAYTAWNLRIPTHKLNQFLTETVAKHPPPLVSGRRINIKYMTQIKKRPPTFVLFLSKPESLPASYLQYITNKMRETFDLQGIPIRLMTRSGKNPYVA